MNEIYDCENKRFNIFDEEIATAVSKCYKSLNNSERVPFISNFKTLWNCNLGTADLQKESSVNGFNKLKETIIELHREEQEKDYGLKAALSETFVQNIDGILSLIKVKLEEEKNTKI